MLRKLIIVSVMMLLSVALYSEPISKDKARKMAEEFFGVELSTKSLPMTLVWTGPDSATKSSSEQVPFYVYNYGNEGFVIVSGDDSIEPILAYSFDHAFILEGMPEEIYSWYKQKADIINYAIKNNITSEARPSTKASGSVLLQTASWHQSHPFNQFCPEDSGGQTVTGCTNTAAAILMRYYSYPEKGVGTIPSYKYTSADNTLVTLPEIPLGHTYDWENMPLDGPYTEEQGKEIAILMYEIGVMNQSFYASEGTGAYSEPVKFLSKYYGYDKSVKYYYRDGFSDSQWEGIIRDALDQAHPVIMSGYDNTSGHTFVIDGYRNEYYFHINFGWGANYNAYEVITPIVGKESALIDFYLGQTIIPNLYPDAGGIMEPSFTVTEEMKISWDETGENHFTVTAKGVYSETDLLEGTFILALIDSDHNVVKYLGEETTVSTEWKGYPSPLSISISGYLTDVNLDNKIALCCKVGDSYKLVHQTEDQMIKLAYGDALEDKLSLSYSKTTGNITVSKPIDITVCVLNEAGEVIRKYSSTTSTVEIRSSESFFKDTFYIQFKGHFEEKRLKVSVPQR